MEPSIVCPNCRAEIKLTETLAAPLIEAAKRDSEAKLRQKEAEIAKREAAIKEAGEAIDAQVAARLKAERKKVEEEERKKAAAKFSLDLHDKEQQLEELTKAFNEREAKLAEAQKAQAEACAKSVSWPRRGASWIYHRKAGSRIAGRNPGTRQGRGREDGC